MERFMHKLMGNLRKPSTGFCGGLARRIFAINKVAERTCIELLDIQPNHNVLEVGFGPGHGFNHMLKSGYRNGSGIIYGVDFSEPMCDYVKKRFKNDVASGKLVVINEDVANMSVEDNIIDKVFHVHCFYFWPDLNKGCQELFRVMKPNGTMIGMLNTQAVKTLDAKGFRKHAPSLDPPRYLEALKNVGFVDVEDKIIQRGTFPRANLLVMSCKKPQE